MNFPTFTDFPPNDFKAFEAASLIFLTTALLLSITEFLFEYVLMFSVKFIDGL